MRPSPPPIQEGTSGSRPFENGSATDALADAVAWAVGCAGHVPARFPADTPGWRAFCEQVRRHRVGALLHTSGWTETSGAPDEVRATLEASSHRTMGAALRAVALQRELVALLEGSTLNVLVLKGPSVALRAHGNLASRDVGDVDLLVGPEQLADSVRVLGASGFEPVGLEDYAEPEWRTALGAVLGAPQRYPLLKAVTLRRGNDIVEVHWRLFGNPHLLPVDPTWFPAPARIDLAGSSTPVLPLTALWRYLLVHGAQHRWLRMKWLADVPALAGQHPELLAPSALRAVSDDGLGRCVAGGLLLAEQVLGRFLSDHARAWAQAVRVTRPLVRDSMVALRRYDALERAVPLAELPTYAVAQLTRRPDARYRRAEVRRLLLQAGRVHTVPDPGLSELGRVPRDWVARRVRRATSI